MIGEKFGRLSVVAFSHYSGKHRKHWLCVCECGAQKSVQQSLLKSGNTKSCGCLVKDNSRARRLPGDRGVINQIILQYKRHARDRGIAWQLNFDDVEGLVRRACHYCGDPAGNLKKTKNHPGFAHNGIDRRDRTKPYTLENCVPCCGTCNMAKGKMSEGEFIAHAQRIADQWGDYLLSIRAAIPRREGSVTLSGTSHNFPNVPHAAAHSAGAA